MAHRDAMIPVTSGVDNLEHGTARGCRVFFLERRSQELCQVRFLFFCKNESIEIDGMLLGKAWFSFTYIRIICMVGINIYETWQHV